MNIREVCPNSARKKKEKEKNPDRNPEASEELASRGLARSKGSKLQVFQGGILKLPAINLGKPFGFPQSLKGVLKEGTKCIFDSILFLAMKSLDKRS